MFQKGKSGNPGGRPKAVKDVIELAREHTVAAVAALARIVGDASQPPAAIVAASEALLNRGWGKPSQTIDLTHHLPASAASDADLLAIIAAGSRAATASPDDPDEPGGMVH